ncbi:hypothetical protein J2S41_004235 [Catenuloplanes atrovinosus]|uniref:CBM-cenC domain-containing protein n=1 Tax=Catenuloplanes atrovinosus TaxID=137266 RepID=A0AAE3YRT3_9ACTN|nr:hypothetical protein [Catenuloplanes atrovinosus]
MSGCPDPSGADGPAQFVAALIQLRAWAGQPSLRTLRDLARPAGALPTSTVHEILAGQRLPRLQFVEAYVRACLRAHGDAGPGTEAVLDQWREAWRRLASGRSPSAPRGSAAPSPLPPAEIVTPALLPVAGPPPREIIASTMPPRRSSSPVAAVAGFLAGLVLGGAGVWFLPEPAAERGAPASVPSEGLCASAPPERPGGPELIVNGGFDRPLGRPWRTSSAKVELTAADDALVAHVMGGTGNPWDAMVVHDGLALRAGASYTLLFRISANVPARVRVTVQDGAPPDSHAALVRDVPAGPRPCLVALTFTAGRDTAAGELSFGAGGLRTAYSLTLDDVSLSGPG